LVISGTYSGVTFVIEGTVDGTNWFGLAAGDMVASGSVVAGTITPATNAIYAWRVLCENCSQVRARVTGISTGTVTFLLQSGSFVALPIAAIQGGGAFLSSGPAIGYTTGTGGSVTQTTNRTNGVTLSNLTGTITTNNTSLAASSQATFTVTNTKVAITDNIILTIQSGAVSTGTKAVVTTVAAGSFKITIMNESTATAETGPILINFAVIKGSIS
jgi:hypothetical protein